MWVAFGGWGWGHGPTRAGLPPRHANSRWLGCPNGGGQGSTRAPPPCCAPHRAVDGHVPLARPQAGPPAVRPPRPPPPPPPRPAPNIPQVVRLDTGAEAGASAASSAAGGGSGPDALTQVGWGAGALPLGRGRRTLPPALAFWFRGGRVVRVTKGLCLPPGAQHRPWHPAVGLGMKTRHSTAQHSREGSVVLLLAWGALRMAAKRQRAPMRHMVFAVVWHAACCSPPVGPALATRVIQHDSLSHTTACLVTSHHSLAGWLRGGGAYGLHTHTSLRADATTRTCLTAPPSTNNNQAEQPSTGCQLPQVYLLPGIDMINHSSDPARRNTHLSRISQREAAQLAIQGWELAGSGAEGCDAFFVMRAGERGWRW